MCGRFQFTCENNPKMAEKICQLKQDYPQYSISTGEIFPTNSTLVALEQQGKIVIGIQYWGFPHFKKSNVIINARAETITQKKLFQDSFLHRRCAILSSGFYEWDTQKQKYFFYDSDHSYVYLGGIYQTFGQIDKFVILTTQANQSISDIHHRMPVLIPRKQLISWLTDTDQAMQMIQNKQPLLQRQVV